MAFNSPIFALKLRSYSKDGKTCFNCGRVILVVFKGLCEVEQHACQFIWHVYHDVVTTRHFAQLPTW